MFSDVEDCQDVGMGQRRQRFRLSLESFQCGGVQSLEFQQSLYRYRSRQVNVICPVDLSHPAFPDQGRNLVTTGERVLRTVAG